MATITSKIYCDESRTSQSRWMVIGGIWIPVDVETAFEKACYDFRLKDTRSIHAFFKWTKASNSMSKLYKGFVDIFFKFPEVYFKCILVDTHKVNYALHKGEKELAFYKFYYELLSRSVNYKERYLVLTDRRNNEKTGRLNDLKNTVNNYCRKQSGISEDIIRNIEPRESRNYNILQMVDIFIGAIGYQYEEYTTSPVKLEIVKYIARKAFNKDRFVSTTKNFKKFNIWQIEL